MLGVTSKNRLGNAEDGFDAQSLPRVSTLEARS